MTGTPYRTFVLPDPYALDSAVDPEDMSDDRGDPDVDQSVNLELDWLRDVYRMVDPRFNQVNREGLERALAGLDVAHISFVRDLNSVILKDQLEIIGGCPESYEQISLYTDYIIVDNFLTHLMNEAATNAVAVAPEMSPSRRPLPAHAELDCGFTWEQGRHTVEGAFRIHRKRRGKHFVSKLWLRSSIRRLLKILLAIFVLAFVEQGLERFAPGPFGEWTRHMRKETVLWLVDSFSRDAVPSQRPSASIRDRNDSLHNGSEPPSERYCPLEQVAARFRGRIRMATVATGSLVKSSATASGFKQGP